MNIEDKFSILADEIRGEQITELRSRLLPKIIIIEKELNEIKDILRVHTKIEVITSEHDEGKVSKIRKLVLEYLQTEQLNMSQLRELINTTGIVKEDDEGDQSTVRGIVSAMCRDKIILKTDERMRNAPYYINPNPPVNQKYFKKKKPASDPIKWETELPEILKDGMKTTKHVMGIIAKKYDIDLENEDENYRLSNNLRYATHHQAKNGKLEKIRKGNILYLALPDWNQERLNLSEDQQQIDSNHIQP